MRWMLLVIVLAWIMLVSTLFMGCSSMPKRNEGVYSKNVPTPASIALAPGLDRMIIFSVAGVGIGLGLFFLVPEAHRVSTMILAIAGGVEASALILRVSLSWLPYAVAFVALLGITLLGYELYRKYKKS